MEFKAFFLLLLLHTKLYIIMIDVEFFSKVKTACDDGVARCFITGVALSLSTSSRAASTSPHITNDLRSASLYGFTEADVRNELARL